MDVFRKNRCLIWLFVLATSVIFKPACIAQIITTIIPTINPTTGGTNFNIFVDQEVVNNSSGNLMGTNIGPLVSVTDGTNSIPFTVILENPGVREICQFPVTVPADVSTNSVTLMWSNYSTVLPVVTGPIFVTQPQNQSVFVGAAATFSTLAVHTTGYQWQMNGTNLVEGSHYFGVTNATLTISNLQMSDAGNYTVVASHPLNPAAATATLSVYKPIVLGLGTLPPSGGFTLSIANQDGSPFEAARISNLQIYSTTNLTEDSSAWNLETSTGAISNGILQIAFPDDGSAGKYWRVFEQ
jgi:hypothetical protein